VLCALCCPPAPWRAGFAGSWDATKRPIHSSQLLLLQKQTASLAGLQPGAGTVVSSSSSGSGPVGSSSSSGSQAGGGAASAASSKQARVGPKGEAPAPDAIPEPPDFNWKAYLLRYPDLRAGNIRTREAAAWHYTQQGHKEGRRYGRVPVLLRYTACQGLFNQMYAHLNALVLADYLGADVMLPPSVFRESFSKYFSMDVSKNEVVWTPASAGALLDVDAIAAHYAQKGAAVCGHGGVLAGGGAAVLAAARLWRALLHGAHSRARDARRLLLTSAAATACRCAAAATRAPLPPHAGMRVLPSAPYESFPDCMHPQDAFPRYTMPDVAPQQVVRMGDTYLQSMHIWYIWDRAAELVLGKHKELVAAGHDPNTTVVLDLPCPFLGIMTLTCMEAAQEAATALKFNRSLVAMARTIINGMRQQGVPRYNGAHLRCVCVCLGGAGGGGGAERARARGMAVMLRRDVSWA
jgi:hypothetical protein